MDRSDSSGPTWPPAWQPLVSSCRWTILAHALKDCSKLVDNLRVVLAQLSAGVRGTLMDNVIQELASDVAAPRALWHALVIAGDEVKLCSAEALGRLLALGDDAPARPLRSLPAAE